MAEPTQPKRPLSEGDLVVLRLAYNPLYFQCRTVEQIRNPTVQEVSQGCSATSLNLDLAAGTWSWRRCNPRKIGEGLRYIGRDDKGSFDVIGVYDRNSMKHLSDMVDTVGEIIRRE